MTVAKSFRSSAGMPRKKPMRRTSCSWRPMSGWSGRRRIASGFVRAVSSISTPPSAQAMTVIAFARAVEDEAEVVLVRDVGGRRHEHGLDRRALDVETDDLAGPLLRLLRRGGELHAAGLAAAADQDLGLDHDRAADALGGGAGLLGRRGRLALEERHAVAREDLLAPILLELHAGLLLRRCVGSGSARAVTGGDCSETVPDAGRHLFRRSSGQ